MTDTKSFAQNYAIHFDECDPAKIMYFAQIFNISHRIYESWLLSIKSEWKYWFDNPEWGIPIINSNSQYFKPLLPGVEVQIILNLQHLGNSSFTTKYLWKKDETLLAHCEISHVFVSKINFQKIEIPIEIKEKFKFYHQE